MTQDERREWLKDRQKGIGGTDIATLAGLGFGDATRWRLRGEGRDEVVDSRASPIMQMGLATEEHNAALYAKRTGARLIAPGMMWSADLEWAFATLDRVARFPVADGTIDEVRPAELKYTLFFDDDVGRRRQRPDSRRLPGARRRGRWRSCSRAGTTSGRPTSPPCPGPANTESSACPSTAGWRRCCSSSGPRSGVSS